MSEMSIRNTIVLILVEEGFVKKNKNKNLWSNLAITSTPITYSQAEWFQMILLGEKLSIKAL